MKKITLFVILILSVIFYSCDGSTSGGEVITPGVDDAYIVDAALCTGIENSAPSGITNYFFTGERVNLWVTWANVAKDQKVTAEWYQPDNTKLTDYTLYFQSNAERQISISYLDFSSLAAKGEWIVKLYLNNRFMRSYRFTVN
jgi:hypothetical protein